MLKNGVVNMVFDTKDLALEYIYNNPGKLRNLIEFESNTKYRIFYNETTNIGDVFNHAEEGIDKNGVSSITLKLTVYII